MVIDDSVAFWYKWSLILRKCIIIDLNGMRFSQQNQYNMSILNSHFNENTAASYGGAIAAMVSKYNWRCAGEKWQWVWISF